MRLKGEVLPTAAGGVSNCMKTHVGLHCAEFGDGRDNLPLWYYAEGDRMVDAHVHIERGPYTMEWIWSFVDYARRRGITDLYLQETPRQS